jgi:hypothetical protein
LIHISRDVTGRPSSIVRGSGSADWLGKSPGSGSEAAREVDATSSTVKIANQQQTPDGDLRANLAMGLMRDIPYRHSK